MAAHIAVNAAPPAAWLGLPEFDNRPVLFLFPNSPHEIPVCVDAHLDGENFRLILPPVPWEVAPVTSPPSSGSATGGLFHNLGQAEQWPIIAVSSAVAPPPSDMAFPARGATSRHTCAATSGQPAPSTAATARQGVLMRLHADRLRLRLLSERARNLRRTKEASTYEAQLQTVVRAILSLPPTPPEETSR